MKIEYVVKPITDNTANLHKRIDGDKWMPCYCPFHGDDNSSSQCGVWCPLFVIQPGGDVEVLCGQGRYIQVVKE